MRPGTNRKTARQWARALVVLAGILGFTAAMHAHPGHSVRDASLSHLITSPYHVAVGLAFGLGLMALAWLVRSSIARRLLRGGGLTLIAGTLILWLLTH